MISLVLIGAAAAYFLAQGVKDKSDAVKVIENDKRVRGQIATDATILGRLPAMFVSAAPQVYNDQASSFYNRKPNQQQVTFLPPPDTQGTKGSRPVMKL